MRYCEKSIKEVCGTNAEIVRKIYDHMFETRGISKVCYRPFPYYKEMDIIHKAGPDFSQIFPEYEVGDYAFISVDADGPYDRELIINVAQNKNAEVYFNGEQIPTHDGDLRGIPAVDADILFKKGKNRIVVKLVADEEGFEGYLRILIPGLRMGAGSYVYCTRQYIDNDGFEGQSVIRHSRLYKKDEVFNPTYENIDWIFPVKPEQSNVKVFDFNKLCEEKGNAAYVYTECKGKLVIEHNSPIKVMSEGEVLYISKEKGTYEADFSEFTPLLIKSGRKGDWGFTATAFGETQLSFVEGDTCPDLQWIWSGPYGRETEPFSYPYAPEKKLDFAEPMPSACGKTCYWNFLREHTYLRQNVETSFWGQWFYAIMVGVEGMRQTAAKLDIEEFYDYYMSFGKTISQHRDYAKHDNMVSGYSSYLSASANFNNLDSIGTFGITLCEYYLISGDNNAKRLIELMANKMMTNVPRFEDGTFHRGKTMWTDDMYMCLPFLARLGAIFSEDIYFDEAARQIFGFRERMYMHDQNIYSHIYFPPEDFANRVPWGRGNGWVLLAMSELLMLMPEDHKDRAKVLEIFQNFAGGVLNCRDKRQGIWHQVINNHDSYVETSGSAMFITALARGVKFGWLDEGIKDTVVEAWNSLCERCVDTDGNVYGVCQGSGCNKEEKYYLNLGTITNDDHGVGIVLGAGVAVMNMLGE